MPLDSQPRFVGCTRSALAGELVESVVRLTPQADVEPLGEVGASNRQAMTKVNQALREIMSMGRVEEKYVIVNTPLKQFIDKDLRKLANVWISMDRKGKATVHLFKWQRYSETLLTPKVQSFKFEDIPTGTELRNVYNQLTREKRAKMRGEDGGGFLPREEHQEVIDRVRSDAKKAERNRMIRALAHHDEIDLSQYKIADVADVSQPTVSDIVSTEPSD